MDRAEKIGLGTAVGGHVLLFGALSLGLLMSTDRIEKPKALSVSLVGEISDVSTAPDAIQEEPAPAPAAEVDSEPAPPEPTPERVVIEKPLERAVKKPVEPPAKKVVTPPAKTAVKKPPVKQQPAKTATKQVTKQTPTKTSAKQGGFSKSFEDSISAVGKTSGSGKAVGTPAAKSATEVRRTVNAALGPQIKPYLRSCAPSGIDVNKIETYVTLSLDKSGRLTGVSFNKQTGVNDSNRTQSGPVKDCIMQAVRAASPYSGLDAEYYDVWKTHAMRMRSTG